MNRHQRRAAGRDGRKGRGTTNQPGDETFHQALVSLAEGRFGDAEDACRLLLMERPGDENGQLVLATILLETGRAPQALEVLEKVRLGRDPHRHFLHAKALLMSQHFLEAEVAYGQALSINPDYVEALTGRGTTRMILDRFEPAMADFSHALDVDPNAEEALSGLGFILIGAGRTEEALDLYRRAADRMPNSVEVQSRLAALLVDMNEGEEALACADRAIALAPQVETPLRIRGYALLSLRRFEPALDCFGRLVATDPTDADAHLAVAMTHVVAEQPEPAEKAIRAALACRTESLPARAMLAEFLLRQGRFAEGWDMLRQIDAAVTERLPSDLTGETLVLDTHLDFYGALFALRFLKAAKTRGATLILRSQPNTMTLLERVPGVDRVVASDEVIDGRPVKFFSLPWLLDLVDPQPNVVIAPRPDRVEEVRSRLAGTGDAPIVAVAWQSFAPSQIGRRLVPLEALAEALRPLDMRVAVIQRQPAPGSLARFASVLGRPVLDLTGLNDDPEGMLATLSLVDHMVAIAGGSVDLRAASGLGGCVLVDAAANYRWMAQGDRSPWFPDMTVHRQAVDGSWTDALQSVVRVLRSP
ncbi:MAG: tetratricopeptide repeat protein [Alphaproteobacteria bacterium]